MSNLSPESRFNFTKEQVSKLVSMQDALNKYVHPEWRDQNFAWDVAIIDECQKLREHLGWKWWKPNYRKGITPENKAQVKLEVIDLLHFVISDAIEFDSPYISTALLPYLNAPAKGNEIWGVLNALVETAASREDYAIKTWANLALIVGMTEQEVMETYVQKYVLNKFRQDKGYKDGSYVKIWDISTGVCDDQWESFEDNEVLSYVVGAVKQEGLNVTDEVLLYSRLESMYNGRLNQ